LGPAGRGRRARTIRLPPLLPVFLFPPAPILKPPPAIGGAAGAAGAPKLVGAVGGGAIALEAPKLLNAGAGEGAEVGTPPPKLNCAGAGAGCPAPNVMEGAGGWPKPVEEAGVVPNDTGAGAAGAGAPNCGVGTDDAGVLPKEKPPLLGGGTVEDVDPKVNG